MIAPMAPARTHPLRKANGSRVSESLAAQQPAGNVRDPRSRLSLLVDDPERWNGLSFSVDGPSQTLPRATPGSLQSHKLPDRERGAGAPV